MSKKYINSD